MPKEQRNFTMFTIKQVKNIKNPFAKKDLSNTSVRKKLEEILKLMRNLHMVRVTSFTSIRYRN